MKTVFRRSLTTLMCVGALVVGTQSWANDTKQVSNVTTEVKANTKTQEQCSKPCKMKNEEKTQQDHSQHQHGNMPEMSQMDHAKMADMDHSKMMDMDHSNMNMSNPSNK